MAAITKPLSSPLPPVPSKFTGMPPMSIPRRRPVAAPVTPAPAPTPISPPAATPALASDPSPSPVGSFSSLLSAYSNHTADSPRSSLTSSAKDMIGSGGAYSVVSPNLDSQRTSAQSKAPTYALPPLPSDQMVQKHEPGGQMFEDLPPPPPLKDAQRSTSRPQTPTGSQTQNAQQPTSARNLPRPPLPRTVSETGSIETLKQPPVRPQPSNPNADFASPEDAPLREPDPSQPDTTDNPGAALFPRNWYTPLPADAPIPDARPLTERHYRCLTRHRYLTANRQRRNPLACRVCGHKDRNAEAWICSACYLNVCEGCKGALGKLRGDLDAVLGAVSRGRKDVR
ncbi:hypothetical protein NEMBOFW57_000474 [Staphylotrichum longicolle]|uniref:Uncharacterized protein n=1 Tax=Staphylotrichum longicolle TaxID=669026 RepID=A0AAD4EZR1_9PEZI|nr:hypothetical protein NEMBOFW57_000474 [Staphylotrichum longicolle]